MVLSSFMAEHNRIVLQVSCGKNPILRKKYLQLQSVNWLLPHSPDYQTQIHKVQVTE